MRRLRSGVMNDDSKIAVRAVQFEHVEARFDPHVGGAHEGVANLVHLRAASAPAALD